MSTVTACVIPTNSNNTSMVVLINLARLRLLFTVVERFCSIIYFDNSPEYSGQPLLCSKFQLDEKYIS
jgi:hypothetical protein